MGDRSLATPSPPDDASVLTLVEPLDGGAGEWLAAVLTRCEFPPPASGPVHLAVSGGPDSMALMVLARAAGLHGTAVHVDHGLRYGSAAEASVVSEAACRLGFDFSAVRVDVAPGPDLEARARRSRYGALPAGVLTGHTMDDQAETVLLNVLRGAGIDGLAGMRAGSWATSGVVGGRARFSVGRPVDSRPAATRHPSHRDGGGVPSGRRCPDRRPD